MSLTLLAVELLLLAAVAVGLHAVSRRYGLAPLLLYMAGLVALLHALGALPLIVEPWPGARIVTGDATLVPVILLALLILYDADGAAAARVAIFGVFGVSLLALAVHISRVSHFHLGARVGSWGTSALLAPNWQFTAASIVAFLVSLLTVAVVYQGARNHVRWAPGWSVRTLALVVAAAADTVVFRGLAFAGSASVAGLPSALAVKCTAALLVSPLGVWYLSRYAPRLQGYVGPEDRSTFDILFGSYGRQNAVLRATKMEQRRTEARLREADTRFRHTFDLAAVGIVHTAPDGTILLANPSMGRFLGFEEEELVYRKLSSLMVDDGDGDSRHDGPQSSVQRTERPFLRKDGTIAWGHTSTTAVRDEEGRTSYQIVVVEDVTARKSAEERLLRMERLEAIGQLTGGVAHDFNNLLAIILGDAEMAASLQASGEDPSECLASVMYAARRGARLTQQLLTYSGQQVLRPEPLDPQWLLRDMSELLRLAVGGGIEVVVHTRPGFRIIADRELLESALVSLALNARDAMPRGGTLTIRAFPEPAPETVAPLHADASPGPYVTIEIADTGRGMTADVASRAFEPFFTTKKVGEGSGLGLSMVYGFARQSGGDASLESEPGRGTTVRLRLPAALSDVTTGEGQLDRAAVQGRGETILVVEDDQDVARVLARTLLGLGYRVSTASDATQALAELSRTHPSLVVADVMLADARSGADLAGDIRRDHAGLPVLFVSGYSRQVLQSLCRLPADADVLMKPFERADLARRVRSMLDETQNRAPER